MDIVGSSLKRVGNTHGGEFAGPCPGCGGTDRFRVWPEEGRFWCRQCNRKGDAIQFLRDFRGMDFHAACAALGETDRLETPRHKDAPQKPMQPDRDWRDRAAAVVDACEAALWSGNAPGALVWLNTRGLDEPALRRYHIGFSGGGEIAGHRVERGITIPWIEDGDVTHVNIRRSVRSEQDGPRYRGVTGGHPGVFGRDHRAGRDVLVLTEGELDCLLLAQEAGDLVDVWTLGGCARRLGMEWGWSLAPYRRVLIAYDSDEPGERGAAEIIGAWGRRFERAAPSAVPPGKDISDAFAQGVDLRAWIGGEFSA